MDDAIYNEACEAYTRYHKRRGNSIFDWPSRYASEMDAKRIYLRNGRGVLMRYNYRSKRLSWSQADSNRPEA